MERSSYNPTLKVYLSLRSSETNTKRMKERRSQFIFHSHSLHSFLDYFFFFIWWGNCGSRETLPYRMWLLVEVLSPSGPHSSRPSTIEFLGQVLANIYRLTRFCNIKSCPTLVTKLQNRYVISTIWKERKHNYRSPTCIFILRARANWTIERLWIQEILYIKKTFVRFAKENKINVQSGTLHMVSLLNIFNL